MLKTIVLLIFGWIGSQAMAEDQFDRLVRVRVADNVRMASVSGRGLQIQMKKGSIRPVLVGAEETVRIERSNRSEERSAWVIERGQKKSRLQAPALFVWAETLRIGGHEMEGELVVWPKDENRLDVIAVLDLEDYLKRVLPGEMVPSWPIEALKAQAVAARSYVLTQKRYRKNLHYDVESTVEDQVFKALPRDFPEWAKLKVEEAVESTRGQVLMDSRGEIVKAYFHADCGGATDEGHEIWGDGTHYGKVVDRSCPLSPSARWTMTLSSHELGSRLAKLLPFSEELLDVKPLKRLPSGRVKTLWLQGQGGGGVEVTSEDFRRAVGFSEFRSTRFSVTKQKNRFVFEGIGHGHGVGLCQWGARAMAKKGKTYIRILSHYFPKSHIAPWRPLTTASHIHESQ